MEIVRYNSEGPTKARTIFSTLREWKSASAIYVYPVPADLGSELAKVLPQADLIGALSMLVEQLFADEEQGIVEA